MSRTNLGIHNGSFYRLNLKIWFAACCTLLLLLVHSPSRGAECRFMTFNIHHGAGSSGYNLNDTILVINNSGCNVTGLQEVDNAYSSRSNMDLQPALLSAGTSMNYFYGPNIGATYGNCLLADFAILNPINNALPNPQSTERRGVIHAQMEINDVPVNILATHFSAFAESTNRTQQTLWLKNYADGLSGYIVLMGDFNSTSSSELAALFSDGKLVSTRAILGLPLSIDDIIVSQNLVPQVKDGGTISTTASDHYPYWVNIDILPPCTSARVWELYE